MYSSKLGERDSGSSLGFSDTEGSPYPELVKVNKKREKNNLSNKGFCGPGRLQIKFKRKRKRKIIT